MTQQYPPTSPHTTPMRLLLPLHKLLLLIAQSINIRINPSSRSIGISLYRAQTNRLQSCEDSRFEFCKGVIAIFPCVPLNCISEKFNMVELAMKFILASISAMKRTQTRNSYTSLGIIVAAALGGWWWRRGHEMVRKGRRKKKPEYERSLAPP